MIKHQIEIIIKDLLLEDNKGKLHISLKNRKFYNGYISTMGDEEMTFIDNKIGYMPIKYKNIIDIGLFIEK